MKNKISFFLLKYRNLIIWLFGDPMLSKDIEITIKDNFPNFYEKHLKLKNKKKK